VTGLASIDASGLDTLMRIRHRVVGGAKGLSFRLGSHVARQPLALTPTVQPRSLSASHPTSPRDDDSFLALAMACADVDHLRPRDRPRGTSPRSAGPAAGTSDAASLPSVARAAPAPTPIDDHRRRRSLHSVRRDGGVHSHIDPTSNAAARPQDAVTAVQSGYAVSPLPTAGRPPEIEPRAPAA